MKKFFSIFLSLLMVTSVITTVPVTVSAASVDDLTFELNDDGTMYQVAMCDRGASGDIVIPKIYNGLPVTRIGMGAFLNCWDITSVKIPDSVTWIGESAFQNCNNLTSITIPNSVKVIDRNAFWGCEYLDSVYISDLANWCDIYFKNFDSNPISYAEKIYINGILTTDIVIPNDVTRIRSYAFYDCSILTSIIISDSVTWIGSSAFEGCTGFVSVTIPDSVTSIGDEAFYGCTNLTSIKFPNSVTSIGDEAFYGCINLTSIKIPNSVTSIGDDALGYKYSSWSNSTVKIGGFTIYGIKGSEAEVYATKRGIEFVEVKSDCEHISTMWVADKDATCMIVGSKHKECTDCKEVLEIQTIDKIGHTSSDWLTDKKATVNAAGKKHKECTACGEILETAKIAQLKPATPKLTGIANTASGVKVVWGAVNGADNYIVYRREYDAKAKKWSGWSKLQDGVTGVSYLDKTAKSGMYYIYTVKANNEVGYSGHTSGIKTYFLSTPQIASTANTNNAITVKWGKVAGAKGYIVYRKTTGGWTELGKTTGTAFTDKTAKAGVTYRYTIRAYYGSYLSSYVANGSAVRRLTTPSLKSATSAKAGITLKWGNVAGATGYIVYRKTGNGGWQKIATVKGNAKVSYLDKTAKKGTTYKYTVRAYYGTSKSYYNTKGLTIKDKY